MVAKKMKATQRKNNQLINDIIGKTDYEKGDQCIVTVADVHMMNHWTYGKYNGSGVNSDLERKYFILKEASDVANSIGAPLVLCGDLIDQRVVDAVTLHYVSDWLSYLYHPVRKNGSIIIGGNHEYDDAAANFSTLKHYEFFVPKENNHHIITFPSVISIDKVDYYCVPANKIIIKYIENMLKESMTHKRPKDRFRVMLLHGGIQGADMGSMKCPDGIPSALIKKCSEAFDWVVCGDFHRFQYVNELKNVYYCGSVNQMNFGDANQKRGYQVLNLTKNTVNFVKSKSPTFKIIECIPGQYMHPWILNTKKHAEKIKNRIITIKVSGTIEAINGFNFDGYRKSLIEAGAHEVFRDDNLFKEKKNTEVINKDLSVFEMIEKYVKNKDYNQISYVRNHHVNILKKYIKETR